MRVGDSVLILSLFLLVLADAALTYAIVANGVGYEANPAWSSINVTPEAVWTVGLPLAASPAVLIATLLDFAYLSRIEAAVKAVRVAMLAMVALRAIAVLNNATVLFLHVNLIPIG
jgi:hypothetical protein